MLLRIIGPRNNGFFWFQAVRFPAQQADIEVQQLSTGVTNTYRLDRLDPDDTEIPGRLDRTAFMPVSAGSSGVAADSGSSPDAGLTEWTALPSTAEALAAANGDGWLTTSEIPGFRFRVGFTSATGAPFFGAKESDCLADTLCVSSELAGRAAVLLRIIGPRNNGFFWFQAMRFPAQQADIEVQQLSTGVIKTYRLDRLDPDDTEIPGRLDRTAFQP